MNGPGRDHESGARVPEAEAREALVLLGDRQRLLRAAYAYARYGWPESRALAWRERPATFQDAAPRCRASCFLDALG